MFSAPRGDGRHSEGTTVVLVGGMSPILGEVIYEERSTRSADGVEIRYLAGGEGESTLLFVHGWGCNRSHWKAQLDYFSRFHTVVALDLAGHGMSGSNRLRWTIDGFGADVRAVLSELEPKPAVLIGHSMGGAVALAAAEPRDSIIVGILGVDTFTYESTYLKQDAARIEAALGQLRTDFGGFVDSMIRALFPRTADHEIVEFVIETMSGLEPDIGLACLRSLLEWDMIAALHKARVPIRCVNSGVLYDEAVGGRYSKYFDVVTVPDTGHFLMMESPSAFNRLAQTAFQHFTS